MKREHVAKTIASAMLTLKLILLLNDNWKNYQENSKFEVRDVEKREVEKMLDCMNPDKCYSVYMCEECGETKIIPHSCKSRICSQCGKKHADEWSEKINKEMYAVPYRHVILTVSDRLWGYFEGKAQMQKLMLETAAKTMKDIVKNYNKKGKGAEPGIIMVLHPFGRDLKTNMHVHMLMTEGGLSKAGKWIEMPYIDYKIIRKKWQYEILTAMRKAQPENKELSKIIDWCFKERKNGFNIQAKRRIEGKTKKAARYMARYVRPPAIADGRIINYDTKNVTFKYEREGIEKTVEMEKNEFIHNVIKHIPDKNFKMIRYFGIHARLAKLRVREKMKELGLVVEYVLKPFSWRRNKKNYEGKDPLKCDKCNGEMHLYKVVYYDSSGIKKEYGGMTAFLRKIIVGDVDDGKKEKEKKTVKGEGEKCTYRQICLQ